MAEIERITDDAYHEELSPGTIIDEEGSYYMVCVPPRGEQNDDDDRLMVMSLITGQCYRHNPNNAFRVLAPNQILQLRNT